MSTHRLLAGPKRWFAGTLLVVLGAALSGLHASHLAAEVANAEAALTGAAWPLLLSVGLVAGGAWLVRHEQSAELALRTAGWGIGGFAAFLVIAAVIVSNQRTEGVTLSHAQFVILNMGTLGAALGFLVGRYDARIVRNARQLNALFDTLPFPVNTYEVDDGEMVVRDVNPAFEATFGVAAGDVAGERVADLDIAVADPETLRAQLSGGPGEPAAASASGADSPALELRLRTTRGIREFEVYFIPYDVGEPDPTGFAVSIDVADRRRQLQRLQILNRVLRHDLRNSANVIAGYASLLAEQGEGRTARRATVIRENAEEMAELGERVRALEADVHRSAGSESVDLADLLGDLLADLRRDYPAARVEADLDRPGPTVSVSQLFDVAVGNVLENAVEHNPDPEPTVEVGLHHLDGFVLVRIADDGPGLPQSDLEALRRGTETPVAHTSGLGLWLARWIVEDSGGELSVAERPVGGTEVTITLPPSGTTGGPLPGDEAHGDPASPADSTDTPTDEGGPTGAADDATESGGTDPRDSA